MGWKRSLALPVTLVAMALGILISIQIQTQKNVSAAEQINKQRLDAVKSVLSNVQATNTKLEADHQTLSRQLSQVQKQGADPSVLALLNQIQIMDGTRAVQGPGIQINIDDRRQANKIVFPITPDDLTRIVNTLRFAGAEAISINGQRIVGNTAIVLSGNSTILVNQVPINRATGIPYEIDAIGNQDTLVDYVSNLEAAPLKQSGGVSVSITRKVLQIPAYQGGYSFRVSKPAQ